MGKKPTLKNLIQSPPARCLPGTAGPLSDHLFLLAVEQSDLAISITDPQANIVYVNPAFTRVTGYTREEVVGRNESLLSNKTTPAEVYKALWRSISRGHSWNGRLVNKRKDGSRYLAELTITPVADESGITTNYLGMHRDITDVHQLECQVHNQKSLIESVVDSAPLVLALLDTQERVVLDNQEYKRLTADLGMKEPAREFLNTIKAQLGALPQPVGPEFKGHAFLDQEVRIDQRGAAAPRWFSCSGVWVKVADDHADAFFSEDAETYLLLVAKEVTHLRAQEEKARMEALKAIVAEEERINALRESLSAAIFQLEGPLNMIASAVGMMSRRGPDDPMAAALAEAVNMGEAALDNLRTMIPSARRESTTSVNVNELLRSVLDLSTGRFLAAGISVSWKPQSVMPPIHGHPNSLLTLFKALIDNAIEAMSTRGWRERDIHLTTRQVGQDVEVLVQDTGPGIAPNLHLRVFEPFFTTKRAGGRHMGTGLAIAQQVVTDHGGVITVEPAETGCTMRVLLPITR